MFNLSQNLVMVIEIVKYFLTVQINVNFSIMVRNYTFGLEIVQSTDQNGMRGSGGAAPRKKLHFLYLEMENFVTNLYLM